MGFVLVEGCKVWINAFVLSGSKVMEEEEGNYLIVSTSIEQDLGVSLDDPRHLFLKLSPTFNSLFPRHIIFGNFQCLQCGLCCKGYLPVPVYREEIKQWIKEEKSHLLKHVWCHQKHCYCRGVAGSICEDCEGIMEILPVKVGGERCPFLRKTGNKTHYYCLIHDSPIETCTSYLCDRSWPLAHIEWETVDDLIFKIGLSTYEKLKSQSQ